MFKHEAKVSVYQRDNFNAVDVVIWRPLDEDRLVVYRKNDDGQWAWSEDSVDAEVRPSLRIPRAIDGILQNLVDEIKGQFGIKATADKVYESELQATRNHLEDMRSLIFKSDFIDIQKGVQATEEGVE